MDPRVRVSLNLLPFGSVNVQFSGAETPAIEHEIEKPRYVEPVITNVEKIDIHFLLGGDIYSVPKTTGG